MSKLICPNCGRGPMEWVQPLEPDSDTGRWPMRCEHCHKIYKGFKGWHIAWGRKRVKV